MTAATKDPKYGRVMRWNEVLARLPDGPCLMAEIGVWQGGTSERVLKGHGDVFMHLVDPWERASPGSSYALSGSINAHREHLTAYRRCISRVSRHDGRYKVHRMTSAEAAPLVADASLDLVFIDADHSYEGVASDIDLWRPKVKPSGWIGGHDYGPKAREFPGVQRAVDERFDAIETGGDSTWWARL